MSLERATSSGQLQNAVKRLNVCVRAMFVCVFDGVCDVCVRVMLCNV